MPQVTVPPVSANNLQTYCPCFSRLISLHLHMIAWVFCQCKTSRPAAKASDTKGPCLSGAVQSQEPAY